MPLPGGGILAESEEYDQLPLERKRADPIEPPFIYEDDEIDNAINEVPIDNKLDKTIIRKLLGQKLREYFEKARTNNEWPGYNNDRSVEQTWFKDKYSDSIDEQGTTSILICFIF